MRTGNVRMSYKLSLICLKVIPLCLFLLIFQSVAAQYDWSQLEAELETRQQQLGKDVVILIRKDDSLVFKKEIGTFNTKTQAPIASSSKWLTAALVMQFVDEGKLSLDAKVVDYLPEFGKYFKSYITIRDCLSHMTGIDDDDKFLKRILERKKYESLEEEVNAFARREIRANTGTDFWYGGVGLNIAGRVLEIVSKKKFDMLIKQKLFVPLGMTRTSFTNLNGGPINPSGGAQSTADDYMKFLQMLYQRGKYNGKQILSEEAVEEMMKIRTKNIPIRYAPKSATGYGYASGAWVMEEKDGVATAVTSPGLFGCWPMIDYCRGYTYLVFVKNLLGEERAEIHKTLKSIIDEQLTNKCQ